jgi:hypothetical protein
MIEIDDFWRVDEPQEASVETLCLALVKFARPHLTGQVAVSADKALQAA